MISQQQRDWLTTVLVIVLPVMALVFVGMVSNALDTVEDIIVQLDRPVIEQPVVVEQTPIPPVMLPTVLRDWED